MSRLLVVALVVVAGSWGGCDDRIGGEYYATLVVNDSNEEGPIPEYRMQAHLNNEAKLLASEDIISDALVRPRAKATKWFQSFSAPEAAVRRLQKRMSVEVIPQSGLLEVTLPGSMGEDGRVLLEEVLATYLNKKTLNRYSANSDEQQLFFATRKHAEDDVRKITNEIQGFIAARDLLPLEVLSQRYLDLQRRADASIVEPPPARVPAESADADQADEGEAIGNTSDSEEPETQRLDPDTEDAAAGLAAELRGAKRALILRQQQQVELEMLHAKLNAAQSRLDQATLRVEELQLRAKSESSVRVRRHTDPAYRE